MDKTDFLGANLSGIENFSLYVPEGLEIEKYLNNCEEYFKGIDLNEQTVEAVRDIPQLYDFFSRRLEEIYKNVRKVGYQIELEEGLFEV